MSKTWITALTVPLVVAGLAAPALAKTAPKEKPAPNEHVTLTFAVSNPQAPGTAVATGPIAGTGTATLTKGKHGGRVHFNALTLAFGSDSVKVKGIRIRGARKVDAATCTATEKGKGGFSINGGTGAYAKAKGRGHFTLSATIVGVHDASARKGCSFKTPTGTITVDATGNVKL